MLALKAAPREMERYRASLGTSELDVSSMGKLAINILHVYIHFCIVRDFYTFHNNNVSNLKNLLLSYDKLCKEKKSFLEIEYNQ